MKKTQGLSVATLTFLSKGKECGRDGIFKEVCLYLFKTRLSLVTHSQAFFLRVIAVQDTGSG